MSVSRRLAALVAFGSPADVALLARLGPVCALHADTKVHRERVNDRSLKQLGGLNSSEAFAFYCNYLSRADQAFPLANCAAAVGEHLARVVPGTVPHDTYLLAAAIETRIAAIVDDIVAYWSSTPELIAAKEAELAVRMSLSSELRAAYNMPPHTEGAIDSSLAAFLFGRSAYQGSVCIAMTTAVCFARNITAADLGDVAKTMAANTKRRACDVSYRPLKVPHNVLDPLSKSTEPVEMMISDQARQAVELAAHRLQPTVADFFLALDEEQTLVDDIAWATTGEIGVGVRHKRIVHLAAVVNAAAPMPPPPARAPPRHDPDEDVDDK